MAARSLQVGKNPLKRSHSMPTMLPAEGHEDKPGPILPIGLRHDDTPEELRGLLEFAEKLEDIITLENETALFECKIVQDLNPTCTWNKDGRTLRSDDERISVIKNGAWHRLEIKHVTARDQGIYTIECRHNNQYISVKAHLYVAPLYINAGIFYHKTKWTGSGFIKHLSDTKVLRGENIELKVKFRHKSEDIVWFKNNNILFQDRRITIINCSTTASMTLVNARLADSGVYYIVAETEQGYLSSFADVQVSECSEKQYAPPIIEEHLPDDLEVTAGEEVQLVVKAHVDANTIIKLKKDNVEIKPDEYHKVDYGCNYMGLIIPQCKKTSEGEYTLIMMNCVIPRVESSITHLTVNPRPTNLPTVHLIRPMESAVACCGSKVSFDCRFDLKDPIYFYVVWYIGHYKVERTNSKFKVICKGDTFLLYIKKLEPGMAGDVICELRRSWPNRKSAVIRRAHAHLVIVPLIMIEEAKLQPHRNGKLYYGDYSNRISLRIEDFDGNKPNLAGNMEAEYLLKIACCRLDDNGLYFVHAMHGADSQRTIMLELFADKERCAIILNWVTRLDPYETAYGIDLGQINGSFTEIGITIQTDFTLDNSLLDKLIIFRIRAIPLMGAIEDYDEDIYIIPPTEVMLRPETSHEIQPMEEFAKKYTKSDDIIGTGAFGSVVLVQSHEDGAHYAAKIVKTSLQEERDHVLREFHIMKNFRHTKLIELIDFFESKSEVVFVMEYCWGGELFDRVVGEEYLREEDVVGYVKQICEALEYMHQNHIIHLDLKPENIICISPNSRQVKLIDFGVARNDCENSLRAIYGTRDYVSPEVIAYEQISTKSDMWSLGVLTYMLLSGVMPFVGENWLERSVNITRARYDYDDSAFDEISDQAKNFVDHLLVRHPSNRMSAGKALKHPWITEGPPQGRKAKHMNNMQRNLKFYMADHHARWQRLGNVMIAAHRLRMKAPQDPQSSGDTLKPVP